MILMEGRIFGLDAQLLHDTVIVLLAVFFLFILLSYLVFNPARALLQKRREKIVGEMETAAREKADAIQMKGEYEGKLAAADKEVDEILTEARKKGQKRGDEIVAEAKEEAGRVMNRAEKEIELEKEKMKDEVKQEMITVAQAMAAKVIAASMDEAKQAELLEDTLKEMGDDTWRS